MKWDGSQRGVSLLELMVVLTIAAVAASLAFPSYRDFVIRQRINHYTSSLHAALNYSRTEAMARGSHVTICRSENPDSVVPACASTNSNPISNTGWGSGWIIFVDKNKNGVFDSRGDEADQLLKVQGRK